MPSFFAIVLLIGKLNMDLVGFESTMQPLTLFLWRVEVQFETKNICLSDMILVHKTSTEEIYLFSYLFIFLSCFGWFQIRRKMSIKRQCRLNTKVLAEVLFNSDFSGYYHVQFSFFFFFNIYLGFFVVNI